MIERSFKRIIAATVLIGGLLASPQPTQANGKDAVIAVGLIAGTVGCGYLLSKGISHLVHTSAKNSYSHDYRLLTEYGYEILKEDILSKHAQSFSAQISQYRNYPLLRYKNNLSWYTTALYIFQFLNCFSETSGEIQHTIGKLNVICRAVMSDNSFFKERRRFEERQEDRAERR